MGTLELHLLGGARKELEALTLWRRSLLVSPAWMFLHKYDFSGRLRQFVFLNLLPCRQSSPDPS
jgi:hypothetical protein